MPTQVNASKGAAKRIQDLERELAAVRAAAQRGGTGTILSAFKSEPLRDLSANTGGKRAGNDDADESSPDDMDQDNSLIDSAFGTSIRDKRTAKDRTRAALRDPFAEDNDDPFDGTSTAHGEDEDEDEDEDEEAQDKHNEKDDDDEEDDGEDDDEGHNNNDYPGQASSEEDDDLPRYSDATGLIIRPAGEAGRSSSARHPGFNLQRAMGLGAKDDAEGWRNKQYNHYTTTNRRLANIYFDLSKPCQQQDPRMQAAFYSEFVKIHPGLQDWYENTWPIKAMAQQFLRNTVAQQKIGQQDTFHEKDPRPKERRRAQSKAFTTQPQKTSKPKAKKISKAPESSRTTAPDGSKIKYINTSNHASITGKTSISKGGPSKAQKSKPKPKPKPTTKTTTLPEPEPEPTVPKRPKPRRKERAPPTSSATPLQSTNQNVGQPGPDVEGSSSTVKNTPPAKPTNKSTGKRKLVIATDSDDDDDHNTQTPPAGPSNSAVKAIPPEKGTKKIKLTLRKKQS